MSSELSHALLSVLQKAAETQVEGPASARARRMKNAGSDVVVLADLSGSMQDVIGSSGLPKYHHLKIALDDVMKYHPTVRVVAFADNIRLIKSVSELPKAGGVLGTGTGLAQAIRYASKRWKPRKTIIISDGLPNDEDDALEASQAITGQVDAIYCGPDNHPAVKFLASLTKACGGESHVWDGYRGEIASHIRGLLE